MGRIGVEYEIGGFIMFWEVFIRGDILFWVILVLGGPPLVILIHRLFQLHRARVHTADLLSGIINNIQRGNVAEARQHCVITPGPVSHVLQASIDGMNKPIDDLIQDLDMVGRTEIVRMERRLSLLALIAQTAPILGLIGAVFGLIRLVTSIRETAPLTQVANVADGLIPALMVTAAGLVVSMIAFAAYHVLVGKIDRLVIEMEQAATAMVQFIRSERSKS